MKKYLLLAFSTFLFSNCQSQSTRKELEKNEVIKPKTTIIVHKKYDDKGNLIKIDSSYSYVYSNIKNDSLLEKELFNNLKLNFNQQHTNLDSIFKNSFSNDKILKMNDFYTDDFFEKHMKQQIEEMQKTMKKFDSVKNNFYKKQFLIENDKKSELKHNKKL
jgi:hypothetical protein